MHPRNNRQQSIRKEKNSKEIEKALENQAEIKYDVVNKDGVVIPNIELSINEHFEVLNVPTEVIDNDIEDSNSKVASSKEIESLNNDGVSLF